MIRRAILSVLFLTGCVSSLNTVGADGIEQSAHPGQQAANIQFESPATKPDFESRVARSFDDLLLMVEAEGLQIEDVQKITIVVKSQNELWPRYLVQTPKMDWKAYRR